MEAKHTPGPWEITDDEMFVIAGKDKSGAHRCIACSPSPYEWKYADASLIAAAPDLLAACELVQALLAISPDGRGINWEGPVMDNLKAAIAKATGE